MCSMIATHAAIIAAHAARKRQEQEESMVTYNSEDLNGWEFKIVRSSTGRFGNYEKVQQIVREEAQAGWELLEKFDNYRLRFKRRIDRRSSDQFLTQDPYRTTIGAGDGKIALLVLGFVFLVVGVVVATMFALE